MKNVKELIERVASGADSVALINESEAARTVNNVQNNFSRVKKDLDEAEKKFKKIYNYFHAAQNLVSVNKSSFGFDSDQKLLLTLIDRVSESLGILKNSASALEMRND